MAKNRGTSEELPAGLVELTTPAAGAEEAGESPSAKFWRCQIHLPTRTYPGDHDHVVRAPDRANAESAFFQEMGIISVNRTETQLTVEPATELEFIHAQAKRFHVDLKEHRQVPPGAKKNVKGVIEGYYPLAWQPPGGAEGKYLINEKGETKPAE